MDIRISQSIEQSIVTKQAILGDAALMQRIQEAADVMTSSLRNGGKILFCGNGGSAADAQHLAAELSGRFYYDRPPLNADALHCNTSYLTAVGNDYGYEQVFARLVQASARVGDIVVGISTSGNSNNIVNAYRACRDMGVGTISLTGLTGGKMKELSDILINVPSNDTPRIQECHIMIGHIICELIEAAIFPRN